MDSLKDVVYLKIYLTGELPAEVRTRLDQFIDELAETTPEGGAP